MSLNRRRRSGPAAAGEGAATEEAPRLRLRDHRRTSFGRLHGRSRRGSARRPTSARSRALSVSCSRPGVCLSIRRSTASRSRLRASARRARSGCLQSSWLRRSPRWSRRRTGVPGERKRPRLLASVPCPRTRRKREMLQRAGSGPGAAGAAAVGGRRARSRGWGPPVGGLRLDETPLLASTLLRARSSTGRAPPWHGGGRRFDSDRVHPRRSGERPLLVPAEVVGSTPIGSTPGALASALSWSRRRSSVRLRSGPPPALWRAPRARVRSA
ncbi:hypothetical protein BH24ACT26_BH24ACT26_16090 [soil metagenome]